jgi:hypothetical protein
MRAMNIHGILKGIGIIGLLIGAGACAHSYDAKDLEGAWDCKVSWTWDNDGEPVPCGVEWHATCKDRKMSSVGVLSLGAAQWDETIEGTCTLEGEDLVGTRTSIKTVPRNDEARQFQQERTGGRSLSHEQPDPNEKSRSRITSFTGTQLVAITGEGRTFTCNRP